jgi:signal transduction histidine kinase
MTELAVRARSAAGVRLVRRFSPVKANRGFWAALWVAAAAGTAGSLALFVVQRNLPVDPVQVVLRLVGASFAACGLVAWRRRPDNRSGLLMTLAGFAVFLAPVLGLLDDPVARTLALWLSDLWLLFFVPLVLTLLAGGRLRTRADRAITGAVLVLIGVLTPLHLMFTPNPLEASLFLVTPDARVAGAVDVLSSVTFIAIPIATAAVLAVRWRRASAPGRRALLPGVAGALCLLVFAALLVQSFVTGETSRPLLWLGACSLVTVPLAFLAGLLRSRLARGGLADLFRGLSTMGPAQLQRALAEALGDPGFRIAYAAPGGYLDGDGRSVTVPSTGADRSVTYVEQDGERLAALVYDPLLDDDPELIDVVAGAASVALENRRLHAEAEARLAEVRASRQRVIAAADAERRRIERNLHDGAQQRLVTLALQLSLIRRRIRQDPEDAAQLVTSAGDELAASLQELRELARGIHPAALDDGVENALEALAMRAAVPTSVSCGLAEPVPEPVAFATYFVASEALANTAKYAGATSAEVRVVSEHGHTVVEIADDGIGGADGRHGSGLRGLADRVDALGGTLRIASPPGGGTVVTADIPHHRP